MLAAAVGATFAVAAFVYGYRTSVPEYRSTGVLRITPLTLKILYAQNDVAPSLFDGFVDVQTTIMKSRLMVEGVLANPEWEEAVRDRPTSVEGFLAGLTITHPTRSELVSVSYSDGSPLRAKLGVQLLIAEYLKLYGERSGNQRLNATVERNERLNDELKRLQAAQTEISNRHGSDDLRTLYQLKMNELTRLETMVKDTEINLILAEAALGTADPNASLPVAEIAAADDIMRRLLDERHRVESDLGGLGQKFGKRHPEVLALSARLDELNRDVEARAEAFRKFKRTSFVNNVGVLEGVPTPAAIDALRQRVKRLRGLYDEMLGKAMELGRQALRAGYLVEEIRSTKERLAESQGRLEQLRVDSSVVGQINLISEPEIPRSPSKDKRKTLALGGGVGGFLAGAGLVVCLSLFDRRLYRPSDVRALRVGCDLLAAIPEVSATAPPSAVAAYAMQKFFAGWQSDPRFATARVVAVTGPAGRHGRTELTVAVGVVAAATGLRVLLIDFDPERGLSRWVERVTANGPAATLAAGGVGAVLSRKQPLESCVLPTSVTGLTVLPSEAGLPNTRYCMTSASLEWMFAAAAGSFDLVIVAAGTVNEALDAVLVCRAAETTLIVAQRLSLAPKTAGAIQKLIAAEVAVGGILLNRCRMNDVRDNGWPQVTDGAGDENCPHTPDGWGPISWAVATRSGCLPSA